MKVISRDTNKVANIIVDGAYKFVSKFVVEDDEGNRIAEYVSLEALYSEWKDYKEPKKSWFIDTYGNVREREAMTLVVGWDNKPILEFETKEEAELAVRKLKAWKRLKDKGFKFRWVDKESGNIKYAFYTDNPGKINRFDYNDLDLLFSREDD